MAKQMWSMPEIVNAMMTVQSRCVPDGTLAASTRRIFMVDVEAELAKKYQPLYQELVIRPVEIKPGDKIPLGEVISIVRRGERYVVTYEDEKGLFKTAAFLHSEPVRVSVKLRTE